MLCIGYYVLLKDLLVKMDLTQMDICDIILTTEINVCDFKIWNDEKANFFFIMLI